MGRPCRKARGPGRAAHRWSGARSPECILVRADSRRSIEVDVPRAGRAAPGFLDAVHVTLIEASPALKMVQGQTLASASVPINWAKDFDKAPSGPAVVIGNEFLDCLPIRQAIRHKGQWRERVVTLHPED